MRSTPNRRRGKIGIASVRRHTARFLPDEHLFGVTRGEQPLVRASRASKVAGAFLVLFWRAKENIPSGPQWS